MNFDLVLLSRLQFAFTTSFHIEIYRICIDDLKLATYFSFRKF